MNDEEAECAATIDSLLHVKFWVRNLERRPDYAFWLQPATDRFYLDFVALLKDRRSLVVEYKGTDRMETPDTKKKKALGELWVTRSKGRCIFRLVGCAQMQDLITDAMQLERTIQPLSSDKILPKGTRKVLSY